MSIKAITSLKEMSFLLKFSSKEPASVNRKAQRLERFPSEFESREYSDACEKFSSISIPVGVRNARTP